MKKVTELTSREVIQCKNVEEFQYICQLMREASLDYPAPTAWMHSKEMTCIMPNGQVGYSGYFMRHAYDIGKSDKIDPFVPVESAPFVPDQLDPSCRFKLTPV